MVGFGLSDRRLVDGAVEHADAPDQIAGGSARRLDLPRLRHDLERGAATGGGRLERTEGSQTLRAEWKRNVTDMPAPITVVVRASDGAILIDAGHAQLRAAHGVTGTQEVWVDGKVTSRAPIGLEALEYVFPASQAAAKSPHVTGDRSDSPTGSFGPMQPAGSKVAVRCLWDFQ